MNFNCKLYLGILFYHTSATHAKKTGEKTLELSVTHQVTNDSYLKITFLTTPSLCLRMAHLDAHPVVRAVVHSVNVT